MTQVAYPPSRFIEEIGIPATPELEQCLNRVEYYQPLYGITGFEPPIRSCRDRAEAIESALAPLGRNFRLIDFGSSLGYFPFYFADRGATVTGIDINPLNTDVALATQRVNGLAATFKTASLDLDMVRGLAVGQYDVALILSLLHHLIYQRGLPYVSRLVAELLGRVPMLIVELAHRHEQVTHAWRDALPEDPLAILSDCGNLEIRLLGNFPTHLSNSMRPMYQVTRVKDAPAW